jgi:hypothetical protein
MNTISVTDLGKAAYILMHGYKINNIVNKSIFFQVEENKENTFNEICLDYLSSEFHRFDSCLVSLKKIGEYTTFSRNSRFVNDLGVAAYILMHKYKLLGRKNRFIYFEVEDNQESLTKFNDMIFEYLLTDFHKFDSCLMSIKKLNEYIFEK